MGGDVHVDDERQDILKRNRWGSVYFHFYAYLRRKIVIIIQFEHVVGSRTARTL